MTDICCIGHITHDRIITPSMTAELNGGTSFYFSYAISHLPAINYRLVTSLARKDFDAVEQMRLSGINVDVIESRETVFFENSYEENMNNRQQRVLAKADPFTSHDLRNIEARYIHLGSLLADDFSVEVIASLKGRGFLCIDAQGFLRRVEGEKVVPCDWHRKSEALALTDLLKVNEHEIVSLTGHKDPEKAAQTLLNYGVKEILITLGSEGSMVFTSGKMWQIPAYKPRKLVDATGCGDTYAAGYLYKRCLGAIPDEAGRFAAAMATLKLEHTGAFNGTINQINDIYQ